MSLAPHVIVFSDVDGVLLDPSESCMGRAAAAFVRLANQPVSVVLCSLKTRAELQVLQQELGLRGPFIAEAGSAAFIPHGYFPTTVESSRELAGYDVLEFSAPYDDVVQSLGQAARRVGISISAFSEMSVDQVAREWGLNPLQARLAKLREYVELFKINDADASARDKLQRALDAAHLRCATRGTYEIVGSVLSAGSAISALRSLYRRAYPAILTIGMADSWAPPGHLASMDFKIIVHDEHGVAGAIDAGDWAEAIVETVEELRPRRSAASGPRTRPAVI
jgi:mannosyl-3-phosphoglycerate phosphatase